MEKTIFTYTNNFLCESDFPQVMQSFLNETKEEHFPNVVNHSIRTIVTEILSNIVSHANIDERQRSVRMEVMKTDEETVKVHTRNFIQNELISKFTILLNKINLKTQQELRMIQQETLEKNLMTPGGAGIGLIMIRRRVCKPIVCKFDPFNDAISYIDLELEVALVPQENLTRDKTKRTPQVNFEIENQKFEISGVSYPEDAENYYSEIEKWIFDNSEYISDMQNPVLKIDLDYFNSISLKNITRTIKDLLAANKDGFTVNWYYDADDEISHEEGVQMSEILGKKFNFIAKK
ncbi:MAG: SiaC family regulatory phosphoprotein [Bacteroidales bacterium]|nr:SiaC family regulatory phosphoprotein [Bacteroidales bacterium]